MSTYIEQIKTSIREDGPGHAIKMQRFRNLLHENTQTAGRTVSQMSDHYKEKIVEEAHCYIISWK
jgi:hypothetical protein